MSDPLLIRLELQQFQDAYVDALDNDRLEAWPDFFVEDCLYEIIPKENEDHGFPAPVMRCDNKRMLRDRVISLRNANIFAPITYRHFLSGLTWHEAADGVIVARSNYLVVGTGQNGHSSIYQAGIYQDRIMRTAEGLRFVAKRVIYDTSRVQTLLAIPI
jgi:anthranilate 1,2-dioxygenase small subunit